MSWLDWPDCVIHEPRGGLANPDRRLNLDLWNAACLSYGNLTNTRYNTSYYTIWSVLAIILRPVIPWVSAGGDVPPAGTLANRLPQNSTGASRGAKSVTSTR